MGRFPTQAPCGLHYIPGQHRSWSTTQIKVLKARSLAARVGWGYTGFWSMGALKLRSDVTPRSSSQSEGQRSGCHQSPEVPTVAFKGMSLSCWLYLHYNDFPIPPGLAAPPSIPAGSLGKPNSPVLPPNQLSESLLHHPWDPTAPGTLERPHLPAMGVSTGINLRITQSTSEGIKQEGFGKTVPMPV